MPALPDEYPLEERTVGRILALAAAEMGNTPLIVEAGGDTISYRRMDERATRIARGLASLGIDKGDPVLFMMPDGIDLAALWCGLARRGAPEVPINLAYRGAFLRRIVDDSLARTIVIDAGFLDRLEAVAGELPYLERCIVYPELPDTLPERIAGRFETLPFGALEREGDIGPGESGVAALDDAPTYRDLVGIMYTSGTTGASKGVMVCHAHAYRYAWNVTRNHAVGRGDRYYSAGLPLFHIAGQWGVLYGSMLRGATVILRRGYRNEYFWKDIAEHGATSVFLLGAIANFLWQQPESPRDADTPLRTVGMYPVIPEHEAFARRFGVKIASGYGSTENPGPCFHPPGTPFPNNQCVGELSEHVEVRIVDENDIEVPRGTVGEICVRPRNPWEIMVGYWRNPEATARAFRNLWYHSGDAGYMDEQGRLYFVDRVSDSLRRRSENISSMEVEDVVNQHPAVMECAVFPVWAEETEQEVMVAIVTQPDARLDPEELTRYCNERMPYFMVPRYVDVVDEIPKTPTGKMEKYRLREGGVTVTTWDRVAAGIRLNR